MDAVLSVLPPNSGPGWIILSVVLVLVFGTPAVLSEEVAKKRLWLISALARHIQSRRVRAIEAEAAVDDARVAVLTRRIADLERLHIASHSSLTEDLERLRAAQKAERREFQDALAALDHKLDLASEYIAWSAQWARDVIQAAAEHGLRDLPEWLSFSEWRARRRVLAEKTAAD